MRHLLAQAFAEQAYVTDAHFSRAHLTAPVT